MSDLATLIIEPVLGRDDVRGGIAIMAAPGVPQNLTGWTFELVLRRWHGDAKSITATVTTPEPLDGKLSITLPAAEMTTAGAAPLERWAGVLYGRPTAESAWQPQFRVLAQPRSAHG